MREIDDDLVKRAGLVLVDSREACLKEAGELIGAGLKAEDLTELGEAVTSKDQGWGNGIQTLGISVFKSVGIGSQDVAIGHLILRKAEELSLGVQIPEYD
ncbi:hypothetical protein FRC03_005067 [Tulasnella sp. 419]|nr:hypothetical protein FRC03_005067 [Tulasnella sp. 419]